MNVGKEYTVNARHVSRHWIAEVIEVPLAHTFAANLEELDKSIREAIALVEDLPDGAEQNLQLEWVFSE